MAQCFARNQQGRLYTQGKASPEFWANVWDYSLQNTHLSQRQIANHMKCSPSTVSKIFNSTQHAPSSTTRTNYRPVFDETVEFLSTNLLESGVQTKHLQAELNKLGVKVSKSTVYHHVKHTLHNTNQKALYEDPRKWLPDNTDYYWDFLMWRFSLAERIRMQCKFFDECKVVRTGMLGGVVRDCLCTSQIWGR